MKKTVLRQLTVVSCALFALLLAACSKQPPAPDPKLVAGEAVFKGTCKVCHAQGINGAPIVGNHKMWDQRAAQGIDTLVQHASDGFGLMPAKGGNTSLTDEQLETAITYMLSLLNAPPK